MSLTTKQLAEKYGVKPATVRQSNWLNGYYKDYQVTHYVPHKCGAMAAIWGKRK